ncbi:MAG: hypothetical protein K2H76_00305, partial [Muribaculaceae bacterium]|nr:hypothetical protein [Muribaculaceae bacterium]
MNRISSAIIVMTLSIMAACSSGRSEAVSEEDILVSVGDSDLYLHDVERLIPFGLTPEDSTEMFRSIVENWVEARVLEDVAKENVVDLNRIDKLTQLYRNRLIVEEYLRKMGSNAPSEVSRSDAERFYAQYGDSMILERPIVKGIFLRTSERDPEIENIRKWVASG